LQLLDHLDLTLDQVIWHTVMYHSLTSTYVTNFIEIGKKFLDGWTDVQTHTSCISSPQRRRSI